MSAVSSVGSIAIARLPRIASPPRGSPSSRLCCVSGSRTQSLRWGNATDGAARVIDAKAGAELVDEVWHGAARLAILLPRRHITLMADCNHSGISSRSEQACESWCDQCSKGFSCDRVGRWRDAVVEDQVSQSGQRCPVRRRIPVRARILRRISHRQPRGRAHTDACLEGGDSDARGHERMRMSPRP